MFLPLGETTVIDRIYAELEGLSIGSTRPT